VFAAVRTERQRQLNELDRDAHNRQNELKSGRLFCWLLASSRVGLTHGHLGRQQKV
jgi:hypothetical protein